MELYQKFFVTALKKESQKLGIAYTPVALIDFILHSVDEILRAEFNCCLSDEGVNILDPFIGTGTSMVRLLESDLIRAEDLERKYHEELYGSEILLLAYYIAAVNIEEAFRLRCEENYNYEPFDGIILADTFNLNKKREPSLFEELWMNRNNERADQQQQIGMKVIISNPPWSAGQKDASDDNQNVVYPELRERIKDTYVAHSTMRNKNNLYNTYKQAIRWASDRIEEEGIIAYVTPASWIDGLADAGVRTCLAEEFTSIYVLNLRGDARAARNNSEGEVVFENNATRLPVAITFLIKNPEAKRDRCNIQYREIGDDLKREEKLRALNEAVSIYGFSDWQTIIPDKHNDWINQRSKAFAEFYPLGSDEARAGRVDDTIFRIYSRGVNTGRSVYSYNFSRETCKQNGLRMTQNYLAALSELEKNFRENPELTLNKKALEAKVAEIASRHSSGLKWDSDLKNNLRRLRKPQFNENYIQKVAHRPFVKTNCYADYTFIQRKYQMDKIFPESDSENRVICVPGVGNKTPFSVLMTDTVPDLGFISACQCFPRWRYEIVDSEFERIDNISNAALRAFHKRYQDPSITKDAIFNYVYGILHAPSYRKQFANDLSKELPRIPFVPNFHTFHTFAEAGEKLAKLHLDYKTGEEYEGIEVCEVSNSLFSQEFLKIPENYQLRTKAMRFEGQQKLHINDKIYIDGIPEAAHSYIVNDRTPLEWFIDRYKIVEDKGITNDPNDWFENPRDIVPAIKRIIYMSVETNRIIEGLNTMSLTESADSGVIYD